MRSLLIFSMGNVAIHCESLAKRYRLGERPTKSLREALMKRVTAPFDKRGAKGTAGTSDAMIWALRDVSFDVEHGQIVGLIGRNGAGKSTVLKLLSRITEPTKGFAEVRGRVGSLLEVGTGFHHELTGRENIFLNGAILGMRKAEIERKFDEIVSFSEIERFLDTPVKHYSSGMYVRLAFAVAVHLETEILLVDEVLAVGDAQFQKKCFEKVRSVSQSGRTILFVSHNMAALRQVCQRGIVLQQGTVVADGEIGDVADQYLGSLDANKNGGIQAETPTFFLEDVQVESADGPVIKTFGSLKVSVRFRAKRDLKAPGIYISFLKMDGTRLTGLDSNDFAMFAPIVAGETTEMGFAIEDCPLLAGRYRLEVQLRDSDLNIYEFVPTMSCFDVVETPVYGTRELDGVWFGSVALHARAYSETLPVPSNSPARTGEG